MNINRIVVAGRMGQDPTLKNLPSGSAVVNFSIATNRNYLKDGQKVEQTEWITCVAFGKTAETIATYFNKGKLIYVEGRLQTRSWDGKQGGKQYKTEVIVEHFQFVGYDKKENSTEQPAPVQHEETVTIDPEDIPF